MNTTAQNNSPQTITQKETTMNPIIPTQTATTQTATCIHRRYYGSAGYRVMFRLADGSTAIWDTQTMPAFYRDREYTIAFRVQDTNDAQKRITITHVRKIEK